MTDTYDYVHAKSSLRLIDSEGEYCTGRMRSTRRGVEAVDETIGRMICDYTEADAPTAVFDIDLCDFKAWLVGDDQTMEPILHPERRLASRRFDCFAIFVEAPRPILRRLYVYNDFELSVVHM